MKHKKGGGGGFCSMFSLLGIKKKSNLKTKYLIFKNKIATKAQLTSDQQHVQPFFFSQFFDHLGRDN